MRAGDRDEARVPGERRQAALRALVVHEIEELPFRDRIGRELESVRKVELLGLVLADLRDEERHPAELRRERLELGLERGDLCAHHAAEPARLDGRFEIAAERQRDERGDRDRGDEERAHDRRRDTQDAFDDVERRATDERDERADCEVPGEGEQGLDDEDDEHERDARREWLGHAGDGRDHGGGGPGEHDRGGGREDPRREAVRRRDEPRPIAGPDREADEHEDRDVDEVDGEVGHRPWMLRGPGGSEGAEPPRPGPSTMRCRAPRRSQGGREGISP